MKTITVFFSDETTSVVTNAVGWAIETHEDVQLLVVIKGAFHHVYFALNDVYRWESEGEETP